MRKQLSQDENKASVGTLARGLDILELFAGESPELTQTEISARLGLPVPTVHRLVKLLTERGWLVRDPATRRLRLGLGAARLLPAVRLPELAREPLRALAEQTGETANLATLDGSDVLYLLSETGSHLLTLRSHVGLRLPVHATALGKCLLAQLDDAAARKAAGDEPYESLTSRTVTSWSKLRAQLERVRREGVAHSRDEYELGLSSTERRDAEFAALLHDVGKVRVPNEIINKPGKLTDEERKIIERHTIDGEQMLLRVGGLLGEIGRIVRACHERWDGTGYPDGLEGEEIPIIARIVCCCDAFNAMTSDRSYRKALPLEVAIEELERTRGTQFDPAVVDALIAVQLREPAAA